MAKYIKQEMIDLSGKGEEKIYYRMQSEGTSVSGNSHNSWENITT